MTSGGFSLDQLMGDEPTPDFSRCFDEQFDRLMGFLRDDTLREYCLAANRRLHYAGNGRPRGHDPADD